MIVKMSKITVLGMEDQRKALINSLMDLGAVEVSQADEKAHNELAKNPPVQEEISTVENKISDVRAGLASLEYHCPEKSGMFQSRREITIPDFNKILEEKEFLLELVEKIREQEEVLIQLKAEENKINNLYSSLLPWQECTVSLETSGTEKTVFLLGTIPSAVDWDHLTQEMDNKAPYSVIHRIHTDKDLNYFYIIFHKDIEQGCLSYLKSQGFNKVTFSGLTGTVLENFGKLESRLQEISDAREQAIGQIKSMEGSRKSIEVLYDALIMDRDRLSAMRRILKTKRAFIIKGWIPEKLAKDAREWLEARHVVSVDIQEPDEGEEFPILLENNRFASSVEVVTAMYSLPSSREIDPNTVMAPFFILFFGLMLSDGGYGLIMSLITGFILLRFKPDSGTSKFLKLMFYCGLSTIFWGAMFGGWFGISYFVKYAIWFDMVADPELMLSWSLLFGIIHIFAALGLKAANLIRRGQIKDAVFDVGFWYITFTGFALYLLPYVPKMDPVEVAPLVNLGKYLLLAGVALLILTQGRSKKNIIGKLFGGISSLYDLISFLSDVLSYARLMALGLATSIIASIINQMAFMFDFPIVLKILLAVFILVAGHTINFGINALGAYVHSCRLQFLEFFGKFYTGGGEDFNPLKADTQYIVLKH